MHPKEKRLTGRLRCVFADGGYGGWGGYGRGGGWGGYGGYMNRWW